MTTKLKVKCECKKDKCIYCDNIIENEYKKHFESQCCGRGMCGYCYDCLVETDEQWQLDFADDEDLDTIKPEYQNATYLCFDCADIWKIKN